ncbi:hypothetical protein MHU86_25643 [Fragilaria crotonensis]|nr:hypothetical protein MHU86_25643 [Fragilaria crotonensis]
MAVGIRVAGEEGSAGVEEAVLQATFLLRVEAEHKNSLKTIGAAIAFNLAAIDEKTYGWRTERSWDSSVSSLAENDNLVRSVNEAREVGYFRSELL